MSKVKLDYLLEYMRELADLNNEGYHCVKELSRCIDMIDDELKGMAGYGGGASLDTPEGVYYVATSHLLDELVGRHNVEGYILNHGDEVDVKFADGSGVIHTDGVRVLIVK